MMYDNGEDSGLWDTEEEQDDEEEQNEQQNIEIDNSYLKPGTQILARDINAKEAFNALVRSPGVSDDGT
jgi:hypothetical protein